MAIRRFNFNGATTNAAGVVVAVAVSLFPALLYPLSRACAAPCSPQHQNQWVVESTSDATLLASAVNCSDGAFGVEWRGAVVVENTFHVANGTVLSVAGAGSSATIDGGGEVQLFRLVASTLHLSDVSLANGAGEDGGAIAAVGSNVTIARASFVGNTAIRSGGALLASNSSRVSWSGGVTFEANSATFGGAVRARFDSQVSWGGDTSFYKNNASALDGALDWSWNLGEDDSVWFARASNSGGGAMCLSDSSSASWSGGKATFAENMAIIGGALWLGDSSVSWSGEAIFERNLATFSMGGAVFASGSSVSWQGETSFCYNECIDGSGGAVAMTDGSRADWAGSVTFLANLGADGGGVFLEEWCSVTWSGETVFVGNEGNLGGGIYVGPNSSGSWSGNETVFLENHALDEGGAIAVRSGEVIWSGATNFSGNYAELGGGALYATHSRVSIEGETVFRENVVSERDGTGGAVYVYRYSNVSFRGETTFQNNSARDGGGVFVSTEGFEVTFGGRTSFTSNVAAGDGGALGAPYSQGSLELSILTMRGPVTFDKNSCGSNGGAIVLTGALITSFVAAEFTFSGNQAGVAGGAVFMSGIAFGPAFVEAEFIGNEAQLGGGIYAIGSGTAVTYRSSSSSSLVGNFSGTLSLVNRYSSSGSEQLHPTVIHDCRFVGNRALTTGGAFMTASGNDFISDTKFEGNAAGTGGALRLAGTARLRLCSFVDNVAGQDEGPAVSNIGYLEELSLTNFSGNVFDCPAETFLDFNSTGISEADVYDTVCRGCGKTCGGCSFDMPPVVPICTAQIQNSESPGGSTTLDLLDIKRGHWRARNTSRKVLPCYNAEACVGGITGFLCGKGYQGAYCSVCSRNFAPGLGFTCRECPSTGTGSIVLGSVLALCLVLLSAFFAMYLVSGDVLDSEQNATSRLGGVMSCVMIHIPLQSVKIVIVTWQIVTQFVSVANVTYPNVYQRLVDTIDLFNFDLGWITSASCVADVDFHDRLLMSTIGPLFVLGLLGVTYSIALNRNRGSDHALQNVRHKHVSTVLLVTFLVYSSVSSVVFQTFACQNVDAGNGSRSPEEDDSDYRLRADYRIECRSPRHRVFIIYAGFMVLVYPVGIAALYAGLLYRKRKVLSDLDGRSNSRLAQTTSELWKAYRPNRFYYEVIECARRMLLTGVLVFIEPDSAAQIAVTAVLAVAFVFVSEGLSPYESKWDSWVSRCGHIVVFLSMYTALLLKVSVADESQHGEKVLELILVILNGAMVAATIVESFVIAYPTILMRS